MLLCDLLQQPTSPGNADSVENRKDTMKRATTDLAMSATINENFLSKPTIDEKYS